MVRSPKPLITNRQAEILKLRSRGLTQSEVAKRLRTSRENVSILEARAYRNIRRAKVTLELLNRLEIPLTVTVQPKTPVLDVPGIILSKADQAGVKMKISCIDILDEIRSKALRKIKSKRLVKPLTISILPNGALLVE